MKYFNLLPENDCEFFVQKLFNLQDYWIGRTKETTKGGLFTIGMASYLDGSEFDNDSEDLKKYNKVLRDNFSPLYKIVEEFLSKEYRCDVRLTDKNAPLPGFHIYLPNDAFLLKNYYPQAHADIQYKYIFKDKGIAPEEIISCTLSLIVPPTGSGLEIWENLFDLSPSEVDHIDFGKQDMFDAYNPHTNFQRNLSRTLSTSPDFVEYSNGGLIVHDGLQFHRPIIKTSVGSPRITMQIHGVRFGNEIELFW